MPSIARIFPAFDPRETDTFCLSNGLDTLISMDRTWISVSTPGYLHADACFFYLRRCYGIKILLLEKEVFLTFLIDFLSESGELGIVGCIFLYDTV